MYKRSRASIIAALFFFVTAFLTAERLNSPTWGFSINLPEGFIQAEIEALNSFAFNDTLSQTAISLKVYTGTQAVSVQAVADRTAGSLRTRPEIVSFSYRGRNAILLRYSFLINGESMRGWGLILELETQNNATKPPILLALAYAPSTEEQSASDALQLSALDSIEGGLADRLSSGPVTTALFPAGAAKEVAIFGISEKAVIREHDQEAAAAFIDREAQVLARYASSSLWREAWQRFFVMVSRDSTERLANIAFALERAFNTRELWAAEDTDAKNAANREFSQKLLSWVQSFTYVRDAQNNDFVDLVSAAIEGRGDCDTRALLLALVLRQATINAQIMVSAEYEHAMALIDLPGSGARFPFAGTSYLVAETTAKVSLGLIDSQSADPEKWLGVELPY